MKAHPEPKECPCRSASITALSTSASSSSWVREAEAGGTARDEEMARLKRELSEVTKERDFLKDAACEGFFGMLKRGRVNHRKYRTRDEARAYLFDYLERFHNPRMRRRVARQDRKFSALSQLSVEMG